ncbi:hypothetical protein NA57DRAFT_36281 [Rhizodiscina lignyota]|uniref:GTP-binding protein EsdC n=1 Tax=Rhizodiscina lignyota TaxID=1504668 RepID=A0A9P4M742_9PEZI|nr:hypothetical protein NA57DRAFT_36281 [Rhizodiscina lignyota]
MAAIQLNFSLRTSSNCKTVHLLGSWDNYTGQLPLSKDPAKSGGWKGSFRFQGSTLKQGQRYWYYYIVDGYHVSHDPAKDHVVEPTTGRKLNTLDVPVGKTEKSSSREKSSSKRSSRRVSAEIPKGRSLSPSEIQSPKPVKPGQTRHIVNGDYTYGYEQLAQQLAAAQLSAQTEEDDSDDSDSDAESDVPSLTSSRSDASSPSSVSSVSSCCTCERYGITRGGDRVKLDCKGARCGYSDDSSDCSSESDEEVYRVRSTRRQAMYMQ